MTRPLFSYVDSNAQCPVDRNFPSASACAIEQVRNYIEDFSGALFDPNPVCQPWFNPDVLKLSDVSCVGHLSMWSMVDACSSQVPGVFANDLADSRNCANRTTCTDHLHCILLRLPQQVDIFSSPSSWINDCIDFYERCRSLGLRSKRGTSNLWGDAAVSKLLARKRPALVPVMDSVAASRYPNASDLQSRWSAFQTEVFGDTALVAELNSIKNSACATADWYTPLRLLDIVVWMHDGN
jgi:hypothetical protein